MSTGDVFLRAWKLILDRKDIDLDDFLSVRDAIYGIVYE
jgi:hypothetical protein